MTAERPGATRGWLAARGALILLVAIILGTAVSVFEVIRRVEASNRRVMRAHDVLGAAQAILTGAVEAETAARGYLLVPEDASLESFEHAAGNVPRLVDSLDRLAGDDPSLAIHLRTLRRALALTLADLRQLVDARRRGDSVSPYGSDAESADMAEVRAAVSDLLRLEDQLLDARMRDDAEAMARLRWMVVIVTAVSGLLLVCVYVLFARDNRRERRITDTVRRANEALESRVSERTMELRDANARLQSIVESAVDGIIVIDGQGAIESFNPAAERLFGYAAHDAIGRNVSMLMPSPYREEHDAYLARFMRTSEPRVIGTGRQVSARRADGTVFPVHLAIGHMTSGGATKFTGIVHDMTARVKAEEALREQAALVRLGEMAAVLAHEVKNPLAAVRGAIQVIGARLPAGSRDAAVVSEIIARLDGLNELMKDLLLFARPVHPRKSPVDLAELAAATVALFVRDPTMMRIDVSVEGTAPLILADVELLRIVVLNLLLNAGHAMQGEGLITVRIDAGAAERCRLTLTDSGPGIPADVREKIFTPFFTTKARGTGLGLATARRILEAHGGTIDVDCPPGGGTSVTIELPIEPVATS